MCSRLEVKDRDKQYVCRVLTQNSWNDCDGGLADMNKLGVTNLEIMTGRIFLLYF